MKSIGIVRKVDELGRVVLPKELRDTMGIEEKTPLEIYVDGKNIILRKYAPGCSACESMDDVKEIGKIRLCKSCRANVKKLD